MALLEPDGTDRIEARRRRGFGWWLKRVSIAVALIALIAIAIPAYHGYRPRVLISAALMAGVEMKTRVAEFCEQHRRLPQPAEAAALRLRPSVMKQARSVVWDPAGRSVVITVSEPQLQAGKRFALFALALFPATAWANSGIGFLMVSIPAVVLALVPAIFIEAPVLLRMLGVPLRRALLLSAGANIRSTVLGALIAIVLDLLLLGLGESSGIPPHRASLVFSLVPMFFLTWWIEHRAIAAKLPEVPRPRIRHAVLVANLVSYATLVAVIVWTPLFQFYDRMGYREQLYSTLRMAQPWQGKVEEYFKKHKRLPERSADIGVESVEPRREVRAMRVRTGGVIVIELRFPGDATIDGKRLILTPQVSGDAISGWRCRAPELPRQYTPVTCRE